MNAKAPRDLQPTQPAERRRQPKARRRPSEARQAAAASETDALPLVHELQVPQVELELQKRADELAVANQALNAEVAAREQAEQAFRRSEERYRTLFETLIEGFCVIEILFDADGRPADYRFLETNPAFEAQSGLSNAQGKRILELVPEIETHWFKMLGRVALTGEPARFVSEAKALHRWYEVNACRLGEQDSRKVAIVFNDVTARKHDEEEREIAAEFLRLVNESRGKEDLVRAAVGFLHQKSGCEAVGIRLKADDDYRYCYTEGFPPEFVRLENQLCARDAAGRPIRDSDGNPVLDCMCGNVIDGRFDPSKAFFTSRGSFWTNSTTELLASATQSDRQARNRCNSAGYESLALIALGPRENRLGLLQLNDRRPGRFTAEKIGLWERLAGYLAVALAKTLAEESLRHSEERRKVAEAVHVERQRLNAVLEMLPAYVVLLTPDYHVAFANRFFEQRFGKSHGRRCFEYLFHLTEPCENCETFKVLKTGAPHHWEWTGPDGRHYDIHDFPFTDPDGSPMIMEMGIDVTARKQAEAALQEANEKLEQRVAERTAALRESEGRLRRAQEIAHLGSWELDVLNDRLTWSDEVYRIFGLQPQQFPATYEAFLEAVHPHDRAAVDAAYSSSLREGRDSYEIEHRVVGKADGEIRIVHEKCEHFRDDAGRIVRSIGMVHDITERKLAEERLYESELQFRTLADSIPNLAWWANGDGYITWYNRRWYEYTGSTPEQMEGWGWQSVHDPNELPRVLERWKASIATGTPFNMEFPLRGRDGQFRWFLTRVLPLKDAAGRVVRWFGTNTDVTEVHQARQAAEAANEAKGQFLANISHELRTPMNAILGMIDVALPKAVDPIVRDCLQTARGSADLLLTLLNDLLDSAKIESGKLEMEAAPFSLRQMLSQITRVLAVRASEKGLCFSCRIPDETPDAVLGDRMRLQQVLLNLAGNAVKFTERGEVEIRLRRVESVESSVESAESRILPALDSRSSTLDSVFLEFAVRDTGIGISTSGLERLFQPFAQADASMTRRFGGTGLGLSICKSLVEKMDGRIWVESAVEKGSTFYFTVRLPMAKELPADFEDGGAVAMAPCGPLHILLAEDNPANQKLATYLLQDRGHTVEIAGDGQEALSLIELCRYDVVLMDVQMPGMNGLEAAAAIRKRETGGRRVPIIAMTAHAMRGDRERCMAAGMDGYLSKPINGPEMIDLVESLARGSRSEADDALASSGPATVSPQAAAVVFNPDEALAHCCDSGDMVREMIECFNTDAEDLFPRMRAALQQSDWVEVGRLAHRLKGTIVYLGAHAAMHAAIRVEQFEAGAGEPVAAEQAVNALEQECERLKAALKAYLLAVQ